MPFMKRYSLGVPLLSAIALGSCSRRSGPAPSAAGSVGFHAESTALVRDDKDSRTYVTDNRSFNFIEALGDGGTYEAVLLLEEDYRNENTPGIEGAHGEAVIKAWTMENSDRREPRWTVHEKANSGEIRERFFRLTAWGEILPAS